MSARSPFRYPGPPAGGGSPGLEDLAVPIDEQRRDTSRFVCMPIERCEAARRFMESFSTAMKIARPCASTLNVKRRRRRLERVRILSRPVTGCSRRLVLLKKLLR